MQTISKIADSLGFKSEHVLPYGHYKAKISLDAIAEGKAAQGKLIVVTGVTPTPAGEGKTTTAIGLTQGMGRLGHKVSVNLREPTLGPIFGIKGGGTGGGNARIVPEDEINIHFTGDAHAVASAHNLLAALVDNAVFRNAIPDFDPFRHSMVEGYRRLRPWSPSGHRRRGRQRLRAAARGEVRHRFRLRDHGHPGPGRWPRRSARAYLTHRGRVDARWGPGDRGAAGSARALMTLLHQTVMPNLVQTLEGQPAIVHAGPFGNIAHGCSSILADKLAMGYADYVITEAGFASDLGFEKFMHIKTRQSGLLPKAAVLVASARALKWHGRMARRDLNKPDVGRVIRGGANLAHHVGIVTSFGLPCVVAINRFGTDSPEELSAVRDIALEAGATAAVECDGYAQGGAGRGGTGAGRGRRHQSRQRHHIRLSAGGHGAGKGAGFGPEGLRGR